MKNLTKLQIEQLYQFTKTHRVRYYDLQTEVVDHLASAIEAKWEENPDLPFQKALDEIYANFGIFGFGKLEDEKRATIHTKVKRNVWKYVQSFLTPPKIFLTILLIILWYQCLLQIADAIIITKWMTLGLGTLFIGGISFKRYQEKILFESFLEVHAFYSWTIWMLYTLYIFPFTQGALEEVSQWFMLIIALFHVLSLITYIGTYQYLSQIISEIKGRHPQYNFSRV